MDTLSPTLPATELAKLREALESRYPNTKSILGSQLGFFIRNQLTNPRDLKGRFGGLKNFVARYFPAAITWRGRRGLDDVYDISFPLNASAESAQTWKSVPQELSSWLWSAVTNPSISVQFAWSDGDKKLLYAPAGVVLQEGLVAVKKLTNGDYQEIASAFARSMKDKDIGAFRLTQTSEGPTSIVEFTALVRKHGLLFKWEEFRVENALRLFADRLLASGADTHEADRWDDLLRSSRQQARAVRHRKKSTTAFTKQSLQLFDQEDADQHALHARAVAVKAVEFLSDAELNELKLPLGSVMRAFRNLKKGQCD